MLRNLGIRWQILSALALPVLVLGLISSQVTYQALVDMRAARQSQDLAEAADGFADLMTGLQAERALSVAALLDEAGATRRLATARAGVNANLTLVRSEVYTDSTTDEVKEVLDRSAKAHNLLSTLRADVDAGTVQPRAVISRYSQVIAADVAVPSDLSDTVRDQDVAANFKQFGELSQASEALAREELAGDSAIRNGKVGTLDQRELGAQEMAGESALAGYRRTAGADGLRFLRQALSATAARSADLTEARAAFEDAGTSRRPDVTAAEWTAITEGQLAALHKAQAQVNQDGIELASDQYDSARDTLLLTLAAALAITLLTLLLALGLSRRISAPLRRLTLAATQIRDELPKIVETVQSDDDFELLLPVVQTVGRNEVSQLAAAFVDVNAVTVEIAREQARLRSAVGDMFVNVARRNQVLLSRQLSLIDQLERNEVNPDSLEELFRLDHLATRMRRNAESLLVLAGIESGRRLREPMPLSDVVRTATSEIEHYSRVSLSLAIDPPVFAHLALPVAHLLAELLENATNFSDPGSTVVVMAQLNETGVRITVADDGLGISESELLEINARIEESPSAEALSSQRLGFFVVGRLAHRLDASVTLTSGRTRGTAVLIDLPASLFVPGALDEPHESPGVDASAPGPMLPSGLSDAGGSDQAETPAWTSVPVGSGAGSPFVAAFPAAALPTAGPPMPAAIPMPTSSPAPSPAPVAAPVTAPGPIPAAIPMPIAVPSLPAAFDTAALDAETALEPVWTPQPDDVPSGAVPAPADAPAAETALPARRTGDPVAVEAPAALPVIPLPVTPPPIAEPEPEAVVLPPVTEPARPVAAPVPEPVAEPVAEWTYPIAEPASEPFLPDLNPLTTPGWASSDWTVSEWAEPEADAIAASDPTAWSDPVEPAVAPVAGPSLFSGFRSRQAGVPVEPEAAPDSAPELPSAPGPAVAFEPASETAPVPLTWQDDDGDGYLPPQVAFDLDDDFGPVPVLGDPTPLSWADEPVAEPGEPESWASVAEAYVPISAWSPEDDAPYVPELSWNREPATEVAEPMAEPVAYQPEPFAYEPMAYEPEPVAYEPAPEPAPTPWAPEPEAWSPASEAWSPEPASAPQAPEPSPWAPAAVPAEDGPHLLPVPEPVAHVPEPVAYVPEPQPEPQPQPVVEPLSHTLTAAIDILPQRTSIRSALLRGRRKGDPQPVGPARPFNGGFDPIAPAREFALREGFGPRPEPAPGAVLTSETTSSDSTSTEAATPAVPASNRPWVTAVPVMPAERRQHPRPGDSNADDGRSALASEALTELSRLSSYSPTSMPSSARAGLQRRTPNDVPVPPVPAVETSGQRARTAASVRSMLAGFKAGVERGRTSPSANRPAPAQPPLPPQPRNAEADRE